jgi:uridine kinase
MLNVWYAENNDFYAKSGGVKTKKVANKLYLCLMSKPFVVGICGGSGAGKTTLLKRLSETFQNASTAVFSMDNYYLPIEQQTKDANGIVNFDLPTALDDQKLSTDLQTLISGQPIEVREYFFNVQGSKSVLLTIQPSDLIIVEGLFTLHYPSVFSQLDFSIFVDVDHATQLDRRIYRDQETRGYKRSEIIYQWENHVLPCYEQFIEPYRNNAHFVFCNDHRADRDFLRLSEQLRTLVPDRFL